MPAIPSLNNRMHLALRSADLEEVERLLDAGADVDSFFGQSRQTALGFIVGTGFANRTQLIDLLLAKGANPNIGDSFGQTPLHAVAARGWDVKTAALLLDKGANINARTTLGSTPLHTVALNEPSKAKAEMIRFLVGRGADITLKNHTGDTPWDVSKKHSKGLDEAFAKAVEKDAVDAEDAANERRLQRLRNRPKTSIRIIRK